MDDVAGIIVMVCLPVILIFNIAILCMVEDMHNSIVDTNKNCVTIDSVLYCEE